MEVPKKLKINLPHDPAIPLLVIHLKEYKPGYERTTHVYHSTVHNSQALETAQMPCSK
jgi:hypothetical protein